MAPALYKVEFLPSAQKQFLQLEAGVQQRIARKIDALSVNPRASGTKALKGSDLLRLRVGDYRIIYQIEDDRLVVLIVRLAHRREVYR